MSDPKPHARPCPESLSESNDFRTDQAFLDLLRLDGTMNGTPLPATLRFLWTPSPGVYLVPDDSEQLAALIGFGAGSLVYAASSLPDPLQCSWFGSTANEMRVRPPNCVIGANTVRSVRFLICNVDSLGSSAISRGHRVCHERFQVELNGYELILDPIIDSKTAGHLHDQAKMRAGWSPTYVGSLKRADGADFLFAERIEILTTLHWYLGFVRGGFCGPVIVVGIDKQGQDVAFEIASWPIHRAGPEQGWHHYTPSAADAQAMFVEFHRRLADPTYSDVLRRTIWWLVGASREDAGVDSSQILAQAAAEAAAWSLLRLQVSKYTSKSAFKKTKAAQRLFELASELKWLPDPVVYPNLIAWSGGTDVFAAAVAVRSDSVHPVTAAQQASGGAIYEAKQLLMELVELTILNQLGFRGLYAPRLTKSGWREARKAPWA